MFILTSSGSIYEIDTTQEQIRRLHGDGPPTERVGDTWKKYVDLEIKIGQSMVIIWAYVGNVAKSTLTSVVLKVGELETF